MVCVLVTAGGWGDLWVFQTRNDAYMSPLYQYGDSLLTRPEDVCDQYNWLEWDRLRSKAGLGWIVATAMDPYHVRVLKETEAPKILEALTQRAHPAPTDPAEICRRIVEDRRRLGTVAKRKENVQMPTEAVAPKAEKGSNLPVPVRGPKDVSQDATISFGVDKEGNFYGPEVNNPKKEGSKTRTRFALYREGMTIKQALEAGITTADLVYDRDHGFVVFTAPEGGSAVAEETSFEEEMEEDLEDAAE